MYQATYVEFEELSQIEARRREYQALTKANDLLELAKKYGEQSQQARDALFYTEKLWIAFAEDLSMPHNMLSREVRASLISIALWIIREIDKIRDGSSNNFDGIIEINTIIREGLV